MAWRIFVCLLRAIRSEQTNERANYTMTITAQLVPNVPAHRQFQKAKQQQQVKDLKTCLQWVRIFSIGYVCCSNSHSSSDSDSDSVSWRPSVTAENRNYLSQQKHSAFCSGHSRLPNGHWSKSRQETWQDKNRLESN